MGSKKYRLGLTMKHEQNILVALRVRPMNCKEQKLGAKQIARAVDRNLVVLLDPNKDSDDILRAKRSREHRYTFDVSFSPHTTQQEVYRHTSQGLVKKVISGYNATVFAYGATGAGKTYTMLGKDREPGVMVLTLDDLFTSMENTSEENEYHVKMAYLEIYNETIRDLLVKSGDILDLREDAHGATVVYGLREIAVSTTQEVMALLSRGNLRRTCEPTAANRTSSRSHAVLKVTVEQHSRALSIHQRVRRGVLFMVDLAGSERAANTKNRGLRMKEGAHINRSLLALANCINTLCSQGGGEGGGGGAGGGGNHYVNYRDSKLTRLLKDALSGNCQTVMIAHISPASTSFEESKNTLKYADRAKHLKTKVSSNVYDVTHHVTQYVAIIASLHCRINELERQKKERWKKGEVGRQEGRGEEEKRGGGGGGEGEKLCSALKALFQEEREIRKEMASIEYHLLLSAIEAQRHLHTLQKWEEKAPIPSSSSAPPSFSRPPSFVPLSSFLSCHSPLPTTQEDSHSQGMMSSILFQRSPLKINTASHGGYCIAPTVTESQDSHMTTLSQGSVSYANHISSPNMNKESHDGNMNDPATERKFTENHMTSPTDASKSHDTDDSHEMDQPTLVKSFDSHIPEVASARKSYDNHVTSRQLFSPETGVVLQEPVGVSAAREELAALVGEKQRMEAHHRRLVRRLMELRTSHTELQEKASQFALLPLQRELWEVFHHCREVEEVGRERELAAAMAGVQLGRREETLEGLVEVSKQLTDRVEQCRAALEEKGVDLQSSMQWSSLLEHHRMLIQQARVERQLPVVGRGLQLPTIARLSAKLYTTVTGSKSNLFIDDVTTDGEDEEEGAREEESVTKSPGASHQASSDQKLSSLSRFPLPPSSSTFHATASSAQLQPTSSLSLPPIPYTLSLFSNPNRSPQVSKDAISPREVIPFIPLTASQRGPSPPFQQNPLGVSRDSPFLSSQNNAFPSLLVQNDTLSLPASNGSSQPTNPPSSSRGGDEQFPNPPINSLEQAPHTTSSIKSMTNRESTPSENFQAQFAVQSSKRTSARALLSKVGILPSRISTSHSSSNRSKYVIYPNAFDRLQREGVDIISGDLLTPTTVKERGNIMAIATQSDCKQRPLHARRMSRAGKVTKGAHGNSTTVRTRTDHSNTHYNQQKGKRKVLLQEEISRMSLREKGLAKREKDGRKRPQPVTRSQGKIHSLALPAKTVEKNYGTHNRKKPPPPSCVPVLPRRMGTERRPLVIAKVRTNSHILTENSPYLSLSAFQRKEGKQVPTNKVNPAIRQHKPSKSPYSRPLVQRNKTKK